MPGMHIVADSYAHAPLLGTVAADRRPGFETDFGELGAVISVEKIWSGVIGHVRIQFSAVTEIGPDSLHPVVAAQIINVRLFAHLGESSVAIIAKQTVA